MPNVTMTLEEYEALRRLIGSERESEGSMEEAKVMRSKPKRKASAYSKHYGKMFQKVAPKEWIMDERWIQESTESRTQISKEVILCQQRKPYNTQPH
mgnify:CR=1 FL=1